MENFIYKFRFLIVAIVMVATIVIASVMPLQLAVVLLGVNAIVLLIVTIVVIKRTNFKACSEILELEIQIINLKKEIEELEKRG